MEQHIKTDKYEFIYNNNINGDIDIMKELYRGELYCELLKNFINICLKNFNENVFSHKKNSTRTLTNMLAGWFFTCYQYYNFKDDPFFPSNYMNNDSILIRIFKDYTSLYEINNVDNKINCVIKNLYENYEDILNKLKFYCNKNENIKTIKKIINIKRGSKNVEFYSLTIDTSKIYVCNRLKNIINNIMIPVEQYDVLKLKCTNPNIDEIIWIILFRYQLLSSNNHQLAVLPNIYKKMETDFNLSIECFASAINSESLYFCSLYYDIEKYFGSVGNFFNFKPIKGTYSFNPPYQYDIISNGINILFKHLEESTKELSFIITIPIWDNIGKEYMANNMSENNNNIINYDDFEIMNIIRKSKFFRGLRMISKNDFTYMDHNFYLFKNKTIQNTYVIILSNYECNYIDIINKYDFYDSN
jgi:hypothetical protein